MFVNYLTLMLINLVAGLALMAHFIYYGLHAAPENRKPWVPGFAAVGLIALVTGLHMIFNWPLPSSFNIAYGEMSAFFGVIFLAAALALAAGWSLLTVAIYAAFAGLAAIVLGIRIIWLGLSQQPILAGIGFILAGTSGPLLLAAQLWSAERRLRQVAAIVLLVAALIFALTGYLAYWGHMAQFLQWAPGTP